MSQSPSKYQPKDEEKQYVHVRVTAKQGQPITPKIELYHPASVAGVLGLKGFEGDIVYDPRTAAQKEQVAPPADTVKTDEPLSSADAYRARYRTLFHEDAPFNLTGDEIKRIVDRAEAQLASLSKGVEPTGETDAERADREAKEAQAAKDAADGLPTNKTEWYALFQKEFPDDTTAYADITVAAMREKLGK